MRGVSVGFRALESERRSDSSTASGHGAGRQGVLFKRQELLEISAAPVPLNAMALAVQEAQDGDSPRTVREDRHSANGEKAERERGEIADMLREVGGLWRELAL